MMDNSVSSNGFAGSVPVVTNPPSGGATSPSSLYKRASRALGVTALLAVLAVGLLLLLPGGLAWAQDAGIIEYPENETGAVATFTAVDPEMKSVKWSVETDANVSDDLDAADVADSALFEISEAGELTFMDEPDFEDPQGGTANNSNTYMLVVAASDGEMTAYKKVEVEVTNKEETATTGIEMSSLQPQVSTAITVDYVDGVGNPLVDAQGAANTGIEDPDNVGTDTNAPTSAAVAGDDVEWQWSKSSSRTGTYADITGDDAAKTFTYTPASQDRGMYLRVTATYEDGEGEGKTVVATSMYPVRAFPSGNSGPAFPDDFNAEEENDQPPMAEADDGATEGDNVGDPVTANDANNDHLTYSLEADSGGTATHADLFQIDRVTGQVTVGLGQKVNPTSDGDSNVPSLGKADSFTVTIKATDPFSTSDTVVMTITVDEVDEAPVFTAGKTSHSHAEITAANTVVYTFAAYDPEGDTLTYSVSGEDAGKFSIDSDAGDLTFDASPNFEARGSADGDNIYEVTVEAASTSATEGATEKSTPVDVMVEVTNEDEPGSVTLSASQPRIGVEIRANTPEDPDGGVTGVTWQWERADDAAFDTNAADIKDATMAGYTPVAADDTKFLRVTATYTDAEGSGKTAVGVPATPNVMVEKVRNLAPAFNDEDDDTDGIQIDPREVAEDADATDTVGDPVRATDTADADGNDNNSILYLLSGADAASFDITSGTGQITVGASAMLDHETNPAYEVTVTARDPEGLSSSVDVTIMVTDVDEAPEISGSSSEMFLENGTGAVATFTAVDPEMKSVKWSVETDANVSDDLDAADVADSALFEISEAGELTFMDEPDFEDPQGGTADNSNTYMLVVAASDGEMTAYKKVEVEVTNKEETATTGIEMSSLQPQVSTAITVDYVDGVGNPLVDAQGAANTGIEDPDNVGTDTNAPTSAAVAGDDVEWQWSKSSSRTGTYADITGDDAAKTFTYTPASQDRGMYLRVTATYEDGEGEGKTVVATSMYPVRAFPSGNSGPAFPDDFNAEEENDQPPMAEADDGATEGDNVGDPVTANDANNDHLTYSLEADSGGTATHADLFQIDRVTGQVTVGLGQKVNPTSDGDSNVPSLGKADSFTVTIKATDPFSTSDTVVMTITVDEVDEAPVFTAGKTSHSHAEITAANTVVYTFAAYDPEGDTLTYSVSGEDAGKFSIDSDAGDLTFDASPNFEARGSADGDNVYEVTVKAASTSATEGATEKSTPVDVMVEVTNEDEPGSVTLSASQPRIGVEIRANTPEDPDGGVTGVTWQWERADDAAFDTNAADIKDATMAGYTPVAADDTKFLRVTATYTDAEGSGKTAVGVPATPNVMVEKVRNLAPAFNDEDDDTDGIQIDPREVAEDADATDTVGDPVRATDTADADGNDNNSILYLLSGADAASFDITSGTGQITVGASAMLDHETNPAYEVTVTARDPEGLSSSVDVTIMVTDVDEAPEIMRVPDANVAPEFADSEDGARSVAEDTEAGEDIGNPVAASDANHDALTYVLGGTDAASFDIIDTGSGQLMTLAALDYETKATYSVTVTASDSGGLSDSIDVTITVTNVDEMGRVTFWRDGADATTAAIMVGDMLGGAVDDSDGNPGDTFPIAMYTRIDNVTSWQWARSMDMTDWEDIGTTDGMYTVMDDDAGHYLRATATYDDGEGMGKMASEQTMMVGAVTDVDEADRTRDAIRLEIEQAILDAVLSAGIDDAERSAIEQLILEFALTPSS